MIDENRSTVGIDTDYEIASILGNFSDDFIEDVIQESIEKYRFRPFGLRAPNYPEIIANQLQNIKDHSAGHDEEIEIQRVQTMNKIVTTICKYYNLQLIADVPDENIYSLAYVLYQLLVSEFTERMLNFYTQYIINNMDGFINGLTEEEKTSHAGYSKKIYDNPKLIIIYDNMAKVLNMLAGMDIPFDSLLTYIADQKTSDFIIQFIADSNSIFTNYFTPFIIDPETRADVLSEVKFRFVAATVQNNALYNINTNPYINANNN